MTQPNKDSIFYAVSDYLDHQKLCNLCGENIGLISEQYENLCEDGKRLLVWFAPETEPPPLPDNMPW
jgi:hypothetical protein